MTVPYHAVKRLALMMFIGYVVFTGGALAGAFWWQNRVDNKQEQILEAVIGAQEEACERGNAIRLLMRQDNEETIRTTRDLLNGQLASRNQRAAYKLALKRRLERRDALITHDCNEIRTRWLD